MSQTAINFYDHCIHIFSSPRKISTPFYTFLTKTILWRIVANLLVVPKHTLLFTNAFQNKLLKDRDQARNQGEHLGHLPQESKRVKYGKQKQQPSQHQISCRNIRHQKFIWKQQIWCWNIRSGNTEQNVFHRDLKCIFGDLLPCYATKANTVTQLKPIVEQFAPEFRNLPLQAKKRI